MESNNILLYLLPSSVSEFYVDIKEREWQRNGADQHSSKSTFIFVIKVSSPSERIRIVGKLGFC